MNGEVTQRTVELRGPVGDYRQWRGLFFERPDGYQEALAIARNVVEARIIREGKVRNNG